MGSGNVRDKLSGCKGVDRVESSLLDVNAYRVSFS